MVEDFIDLMKEHGPDTGSEVIMIDNLQYCRGCWGCTKTGSCVLKDGLADIHMKLLAADLVIIGSPVYVHQVSAQMKTFYDRSFIWLHTMRLLGKPLITAVTTAGSGLRPTEKYLDAMSTCMGTLVIGHLRGIAHEPGNFDKRDVCKEKHRPLARKTADILNGTRRLKPGLKNEWYFFGMKNKTKYGGDKLSYEGRYWAERGWLDKSYRQAMKESLTN